jgi:sensor histidine kinase regulating citrate/malate metabolism
MEKAHFNQLKAITEAQSSHLISYFENLKRLILFTANSSSTINALEDLSISFDDLEYSNLGNEEKIKSQLIEYYNKHFINKILFGLPGTNPKSEINIYLPETKSGLFAQYLYLIKKGKNYPNTLYEIMHKTYHKDFIHLTDMFDVRNVYLIDKSGNIVYSDLKEMDFGINLSNKKYNETGIFKIFNKIKKLRNTKVVFENFNFYEPAFNRPVAFIGTPVFIGNNNVGSLVFQINVNKINEILSFNGNYLKAGLGKTGEVYLVDKNYKILNQSRFLNQIDNKIVKKFHSTICILKIFNESTINGLKGKSGVKIIKSYKGKTVLSSYKGLNVFGEPMAIVAEMNESEAFSDVEKMSRFIIITSILLTISALLLSLFFLRKMFTKKINDFALIVKDISDLLNEKIAVIESIREAVIAIDDNEKITIINHSALNLLKQNSAEKILGSKITKIIDFPELFEVLDTKTPIYDREIKICDTLMVANIIPVINKSKVIGVVASFRKKDEIYHLAKELSNVQEYSNMLRAQTHEFSNTLHTIAGLLQTGAYQEALELITKEARKHEGFIKTLVNIVNDSLISAIIIGKYNYAQEMRIQFKIDENSSMKEIPEHIDREKIITILGNLIDNAFESVIKNEDKPKIVSLSMTDIGYDLIFEIEDSGSGIEDEIADKIFNRGVTTKGDKNRGIGLYLVANLVESLNGQIDIDESELGGVSFTIIIPKYSEKTNE